MLAQNFMAPIALGLSDEDFEALIKVLGMFERAEVPQALFNMTRIGSPECGSAGCICGWARSVNKEAFRGDWNGPVARLFVRPWKCIEKGQPTPAEGAIAIRNFLTFGEPRWEEAMELA
jgi:hypothetical protein